MTDSASRSTSTSSSRTIRALMALHPDRLAVMHGSCFAGDCVSELEALASFCDARLRQVQSE